MSYSFDCVVDTAELAHSVNSVKKHVDTTTGAVVAMKAAVIKAEEEGADHVCRKVNQGFYSMIHSQISQKMATLQSRVDAQLMRLNQQRKQLTGIRRRMERDYQMISARYSKLFNALNRNLRQRVTELDRPIMDLATTDADQVTNRSNQMVAAVPLGQVESVKTSQRLATSNLKRRAADAIVTIERFIAASNRLQAVTDSILLRRAPKPPTRCSPCRWPLWKATTTTPATPRPAHTSAPSESPTRHAPQSRTVSARMHAKAPCHGAKAPQLTPSWPTSSAKLWLPRGLTRAASRPSYRCLKLTPSKRFKPFKTEGT